MIGFTYISTGDVAALTLILAGALALVFTLRSKVAQTYKDSYEAAEVRNRQLTEQLKDATASALEHAQEMSRLKAATDLSEHQRRMQEFNTKLVERATADAIAAGSENAKLIHETIERNTSILERIANKLDRNGGTP